MSEIIFLDDQSIDQFLIDFKPKVRLIDFWAEGCDLCSKIEDLKSIASENEGWLTIARIDVATGERTAEKLEVFGLPALVVYAADQIVAAVPYLLESTKSAIEGFVRSQKPSSSGIPESLLKTAGLAPDSSKGVERNLDVDQDREEEAWKDAKARILRQYRGQVPSEVLDRIWVYFKEAMNRGS